MPFLLACSMLVCLGLLPSLNTFDDVTVKLVLERGSGTGIFVKSNKSGTFILTNKHVCDAGKITKTKEFSTVNVHFDNTRYIGFVMNQAKYADLCLIHSPSLVNQKVVKLSPKTPKHNEDIYTLGNPGSRENIFKEGKIKNRFEHYQNSFYQEVELNVEPGQSGSGVFNNNEELVGLIKAGNAINLGYVVPIEEITYYLRNNL